ncbi:hypothetical protein PR202_gb17740 [Eleusine coracana subsp. coracana]|uniref:Protein kinase domain-containing protein n=1 Tax=Eleusine coracana subsp. coracana TaxID=191504 RepID=A0AAV5F1I2_ELECO|nr:hypothetical protein PR202_gb17740 [Eleusine coracana subsp. coracana]
MMDPLSCARTIGETVKAIKKAVDTVKKNRKDCEEISSYADLAGNLIEKLKETGMIEYPVTHLPLKALATSLERARERIKECQQKPDVIHLVVAGDQSARLREAMQDIAWKMMLVNLATSTYGNEISLDIQRQVRLQNQTGPPQHTGGAPHPLPQPQDPPVLVFVGKLHGAPWQQQHGFDLQDLLRASAVGLGKGSLGASFKVTLENGTDVVVKRLRDVAASREEFAACVEATGAVDHRNLAPVRGYAYSEDEKLLVGDYFPAGSLSARLHGE